MKDFKTEVTSILMMLLSFVIPKKHNLIVFLPTHSQSKFSGNLKSLFIHANNNRAEGELVWLTPDINLSVSLQNNGYNAISDRLKQKWLILRADKIIIDATASWLPFGRFVFVQLWHGTGYKNIGMLNDHTAGYQRFKTEKHYQKYAFIVANSSDDKERKIKSFQNKNVYITGSPRNDVIVNPRIEKKEYVSSLGLDENNRIILYAPTFRDQGVFEPFRDNFFKRFNSLITKKNYTFVIKKHPWDKNFIVPTIYSNIIDGTEFISDIQEFLSIADILITDYSGIATDFVLTGRPVLFYQYDYDDYLKTCRTFYYDLKKVLPGPFIKNENELISHIDDMSWFDSEAYQVKYNEFVDKFHSYKDEFSSERVFSTLKDLK
jgi:CDP-glycerol glycerophosphotransferase (TagB/SpsB family)